MKTIPAKILSIPAKIFPYGIFAKMYAGNIFPFYHTVSDAFLPHIGHFYRVKTLAEFEKDLDFLLKNYEIGDIRSLNNYDFEQKSRKFFLSFDDGLRECADIIAPVLMRKGIPAVFFVNTAFIDNCALFFRYKIGLIIEKVLKTDSEKISKTSKSIGFTSNKPGFIKFLKTLRYADNRLIDKIAEKFEIDFSFFLDNQKPYMSSEQIRRLQKKGFTIASHGTDHPLFSTIDLEQQIEQVNDSVNFLKSAFNISDPIFSFPFTDFGVEKEFFDSVFQNDIIRFSFGTAGIKKDSIARNIQRIPMEKFGLAGEDRLKIEILLFRLKRLLNKHIIVR